MNRNCEEAKNKNRIIITTTVRINICNGAESKKEKQHRRRCRRRRRAEQKELRARVCVSASVRQHTGWRCSAQVQVHVKLRKWGQSPKYKKIVAFRYGAINDNDRRSLWKTALKQKLDQHITHICLFRYGARALVATYSPLRLSHSQEEEEKAAEKAIRFRQHKPTTTRRAKIREINAAFFFG